MKKFQLEDLVFIRFFQRLFHLAPKLFYLFLSFFIIQLLFVFLKWEVTPFFLYGMYSERIPFTDSVYKKEIFIDGKRLRTVGFSARELDLLETGMENYLLAKDNGNVDVVQTRVETRYPFFTDTFFYPLIKDKIYNSSEAVPLFEIWFRKKCNRLVQHPVQKVEVIDHIFSIQAGNPAVKLTRLDTIATF